MTPERLAEINAQANGDPMAIARELVAEINVLEAERDQARATARLLRSYLDIWVAPDTVRRLDNGQLPGWLAADTDQKDETMTDSTPALDAPFDPDAAARVTAFLDALDDPEHTQGAISTLRSEGLRLTVGDLREVLRQRAYAKDEARLLAEKCATWRGRYEETRARLEAVRAVANEWATYAASGDEKQLAAANALSHVLRALDGAPADTEDGG